MRLVKIAGGFVLLLGGVVMLPLPGPGWLTIIAGLSVLAQEFQWARQLLDALKRAATTVVSRLRQWRRG